MRRTKLVAARKALDAIAAAAARDARLRRFKAGYRVGYALHAPMEPRSAVAEWQDGRLTVWTGTSNPFSVRQSLAKDGRPVAMQWTRAQEFAWAYFRPAALETPYRIAGSRRTGCRAHS